MPFATVRRPIEDRSMRKLSLLLALVPLGANAGFVEFEHVMKGSIAAFTERDGRCHIAIHAPESPKFSDVYYHVEDPRTCNLARLAYRLSEPVAAKLHIYTEGSGKGTVSGIKQLELTRDGKAYWPPYGKRP